MLRTNTTGRVTSRPVRRSAPGLHSSPKLLVLSHRCADQQGLQVLQRLRKAIRIAPRGQTPRGRPRAALRSWVDSPWGGRTKSLNKLRAEVTPGDFQSRAMGPKIGSPPGKPGRLKKVPCDIQLLWGWVMAGRFHHVTNNLPGRATRPSAIPSIMVKIRCLLSSSNPLRCALWREQGTSMHFALRHRPRSPDSQSYPNSLKHPPTHTAWRSCLSRSPQT